MSRIYSAFSPVTLAEVQIIVPNFSRQFARYYYLLSYVCTFMGWTMLQLINNIVSLLSSNARLGYVPMGTTMGRLRGDAFLRIVYYYRTVQNWCGTGEVVLVGWLNGTEGEEASKRARPASRGGPLAAPPDHVVLGHGIEPAKRDCHVKTPQEKC